MCFRNSEYLVLLSRFATDSKYEIIVTNEAENRENALDNSHWNAVNKAIMR